MIFTLVKLVLRRDESGQVEPRRVQAFPAPSVDSHFLQFPSLPARQMRKPRPKEIEEFLPKARF